MLRSLLTPGREHANSDGFNPNWWVNVLKVVKSLPPTKPTHYSLRAHDRTIPQPTGWCAKYFLLGCFILCLLDVCAHQSAIRNWLVKNILTYLKLAASSLPGWRSPVLISKSFHYSTRSFACPLVIPKTRTVLGQWAFSVTGPKIWSSLPVCCVLFSSLCHFDLNFKLIHIKLLNHRRLPLCLMGWSSGSWPDYSLGLVQHRLILRAIGVYI